MAPPKPSTHTLFILGKMDEFASQNDKNQQKMEAKFDVSAKNMEQMIMDQQILAKQMELTSQVVAQLTLRQMESNQQEPPSPTFSQEMGKPNYQQGRHRAAGASRQCQPDPRRDWDTGRDSGFFGRDYRRHCTLKLSCPRFDGTHPTIWRDKFQDYFALLNVPESMWVSVVALHMDGNA